MMSQKRDLVRDAMQPSRDDDEAIFASLPRAWKTIRTITTHFQPPKDEWIWQTSGSPFHQGEFVQIGSIVLFIGNGQPKSYKSIHRDGYSSVGLNFSGTHQYQEGNYLIKFHAGDVLINPQNGALINADYFSSINFSVEHRRLIRTIHAMKGDDIKIRLDEPKFFTSTLASTSQVHPGRLFSFFEFLDQLLLEDSSLGIDLGLDEVIYRLVALQLFDLNDREDLKKRWSLIRTVWNSGLDELIDYIQSNAHRNLTMTDLEELSHYSSRQLQNLFRTKFDCTPMQFVRKQRLVAAMERLQTASPSDSVTSIARDCGYRHASNFTADFTKEFTVNPSIVLRHSQGRHTSQSVSAQ